MSIAENLERVQTEVDAACRRANRRPEDVRLMAVSKVHPVEALLAALSAGQRLFGENRVQEFAAKITQLPQLTPSAATDPTGPEFHLIGPLQSNKTTRAAELFNAVDTIDSLKTANRLSAAAVALGKTLPILIEFKLSHEDSRHGIAPELLPELLSSIDPLPGLGIRGLMTVPPWSTEPEAARPCFRELRRLRDRFQPLYPTLTELSIGMSNDFAVAIEEGSTTVRIGTSIFGRRPKPTHSPD